MSHIEYIVWESLKKLIQYIEIEEFKGYDPYDAMNSKFFNCISFKNKLIRIGLTQTLKRSPINLRPLFGIKKDINPKGMGLLMAGYVKLINMTQKKEYTEKIKTITDILEKLKSEGYSGYCWGYNFPWQNRERFLPIYTPTIVNTSFIGHAFLDAHESLGIGQYLDIAKSSCQFILEDLRPVLETENELCLSYTPYDEERIYNSNMLGASLLARVYQHTRDERLLSSAKRIVNFVRNAQRPDGSWYYGEARTQTWIDIFHTGFVLEGLFDYMTATADMQILPVIEKGLQFFKNNFFLQDERMKLWHDKNYPIDIHSVQAIIVLVKLRNIQDSYHLLKNITSWMIDHMQDKKGYFYFRKERFLYNKISYMRWSQSWALHALTTYLQYLKEHNTND